MLWMAGIAHFVECVYQGLLPVRLESNVEIDDGAGWREAQALPILRGDIPRVFQDHFFPMW